MRDLTDRWLDMFFFLYELGIDYDTIAMRFPPCAEAFDSHMERMNQEFAAHQALEDEQWQSST